VSEVPRSGGPGAGDDRPPPWSSERERVAALEELFKNERYRQEGGRARRFYPYLLVRFGVGDRGDRPINVPFWESPDIWTADGDPSATPLVPPSPGGVVTAGQPTTVYAHVWNLGRAPIAGVRVEFFWFDPSLGISGDHANFIGATRVDLAPRSSNACHRLVKCPKVWVPTIENGGHECLVVRVASVGDVPDAAHAWDAWADRRVAQRNITVVPVGAPLEPLMRSLDLHRSPRARVELLQVGRAARDAVALVAPHLRVDERVEAHVLGELTAEGRVHFPDTRAGNVAIRAAIVGPHAPIAGARALTVNRVSPAVLGRGSRAPAEQATTTPRSVGTVAQLFDHEQLFAVETAARVTRVPPPGRGQAQVLRVACYDGVQLVGGYTIVVAGA
jgi:hypothetical protein